MKALLREVSRSFYLSIRVLPRSMRQPVAVAYLLARASDTFADVAEVPAVERLALLEAFGAAVAGAGELPATRAFEKQVGHPGERCLVGRLDEVMEQLEGLPPGARGHVVEVIRTIGSGQRLDVERTRDGAFPLPSPDALEDYCHRVAGTVGCFWTRIGFATLGSRFSATEATELEMLGERFGRGLQLINILRDLVEDLDRGRCYLPTEACPENVEAAAVEWRAVARERMHDGLDYARRMGLWRLRIGVALPALLGLRTLELLDRASWEDLRSGVKVNRATVRRCLMQALLGRFPSRADGGVSAL